MESARRAVTGDGWPNSNPATCCPVETWEIAYFLPTCAASRHRVWVDLHGERDKPVRGLAEERPPVPVCSRSGRFPEPRRLGRGDPAVIVHLRGRERALEPFGLTGRRAEWIALASLHGGVFTRAQLSDWLGASRFKVLRLVQALKERRLVAEETVGGLKVCRVCARGIYRALSAEGRPVFGGSPRSRGGRSPPALVRLRDRASGPALASDRVGEGRRVRGARASSAP